MTTLAVFNRFRPVNLLSAQGTRQGEYQVWDANLHSGDIRPFAKPVLSQAGYEGHAIYPDKKSCCVPYPKCSFPSRGFEHEQAFYLDGGRLWQHCCDDHSLAGAPTPTGLEGKATCSPDDCDAIPHAYTVTFIAEQCGCVMESYPAKPVIVYGNGDSPNAILSWDAHPCGWNMTGVNIYRATPDFEDGTESMPLLGSEYLLVDSIPVTTAYIDKAAVSGLGRPLDMVIRNPAPTGLVGLARTEDGIAVADERNVYISLPGEPMFGLDGVVAVDDKIRAIAAIGNTLFVLTDDLPARITYQHREGVISVDRVTVHRHVPLTSIESVSVYASRLVFASEYGLYEWSVQGYGADVRDVLSPLLSPEDWKGIGPNSIIGTGYEFGYFMTSQKLGYSFMVELGNDGTDTLNVSSIMPITFINADSLGTDTQGHIWFKQCGDLYSWDWRRTQCRPDIMRDSRSRYPVMPWRLRLRVNHSGLNAIKAARVTWDRVAMGEARFRLYGDECTVEKLICDTQVKGCKGFGVRGYCKHFAHIADLEGVSIVSEVRLATSKAELVGSSNRQLIGADNEQ